jgi:hypothetical protein
MKTKLIGGVVASFLLFGAWPSQASTVFDCGGLTCDSNTGLQWLDVTATIGRSYSDVAANFSNPSDPAYGFRFATYTEVVQLYADAGFSGDYSTALSVINLLGGLTRTDVISGIEYGYFAGWFLLDPGTGNDALATFLDLTNYVYLGSAIYADLPAGAYIDEGSYLVRATPIPSSTLLFATGLGLLGLIGWRRKRKAQAVV